MQLRDLLARPEMDVTSLYRCRDGMSVVDALAAAIVHFDFFTGLAAGPLDLPGICRRFAMAERPADVLTTLFVAQGLLTRERGQYALTKLAREYLVSGSQWNCGPYYGAMR